MSAKPPRSCPRCSGRAASPLAPLELKDAQAEYCAACNGVWLDPEKKQSVIMLVRQDTPWDVDAAAPGDLPCPRCHPDGDGRRLRKLGVALAGSTRSRVEVDACPQCRGLWLDAGELQALRRAEGGASLEKPGASPSRGLMRTAPERAKNGAVDGVRIRCPHCGSPVGLEDEDHTVACAYCGSWLVAERPDGYDVLRVPPSLVDAEQLRRARIHERLAASARNLQQLGAVIDHLTIDTWIAKERAWLEDGVSVSPRRLLYFPYWHYQGLDWIGGFGHTEHRLDPEVRLAGRRWQHSDAAYDKTVWNLRDAFVTLGVDGCELLTSEDPGAAVEAVTVAAPPRDAEEASLRPSLAGARFASVEQTARGDQAVWARRHLIFKPFLLVRVVEPLKHETTAWEALDKNRPYEAEFSSELDGYWGLVDATRGKVVGRLEERESRGFVQAAGEDPLRHRTATLIKVVGSRCPHCAWDQAPDRRAWARICPNCHSALRTTATGFARIAYSHVRREAASDLDHGYFPFWRFAFEVDSAPDAAAISRLEELLPRVGAGGPRGPWIWIPAIRMLGDELGDETFARLARWAGRANLDCVEDRLATGERAGRLIHAALPPDQAAACARAALIAMYEPRDLRGVRPALFTERITGSRLELGEGRLVMVPAVFERNRCRLPDLRPGVPEIILRGRTLSGRER